MPLRTSTSYRRKRRLWLLALLFGPLVLMVLLLGCALWSWDHEIQLVFGERRAGFGRANTYGERRREFSGANQARRRSTGFWRFNNGHSGFYLVDLPGRRHYWVWWDW